MQFVHFVLIRALRVNINKRINKKTNILSILDLAVFLFMRLLQMINNSF